MKLWKYGEIGEPRVLKGVFQTPSLDGDYLETLKASKAFQDLHPKDQKKVLDQFRKQSEYQKQAAESEPAAETGMDKPSEVKVIGRDV